MKTSNRDGVKGLYPNQTSPGSVLLSLIAAVTVLGVSGCTTRLPEEPQAPPSSPQVSAGVQAIFASSCLGCHDAGATPPDLSTAEVSYTSMVGVSASSCASLDQVAAGDSTNSCLIKRLKADGVSLMPPGSALSTADISEITVWIQGLTPP